MKDWLSTCGVACPPVSSRFPTGRAIQSVLHELNEYDVRIQSHGLNQPWHAEVKMKDDANGAPRAVLGITAYSGDEYPQELYFVHADEQIVVEILSKLSRWCGPLVAIPDTGTVPMVVQSPDLTSANLR
ncbi:hypothetical protein Q8A64_13875 [Oxalobacteraceae bacterium R-40]|uniref:Uncharacterized protein n=1 Tax=Keguizhuia sedimenti TaxID=3064264 RepID=A0ABU1BR46_9BURK|nr:hypothetical protein [Oxalobacteraceae bacterium R-40]